MSVRFAQECLQRVMLINFAVIKKTPKELRCNLNHLKKEEEAIAATAIKKHIRMAR